MGMEELLGGVASLLTLGRSEFSVDGPEHALAICLVDDASSTSTLQLDENGFRWTCSHDVLELAKDYIEPLRDLDGAGHQYLEIEGLAEQVVIAWDEYPADLH